MPVTAADLPNLTNHDKVFWPEVTQWLADRSGRVSY